MKLEKDNGSLFTIHVNHGDDAKLILSISHLLEIYNLSFSYSMIQSSTDQLIERLELFSNMNRKNKKYAKRTILKWYNKVEYDEFRTVLLGELLVLHCVTHNTPFPVTRVEMHKVQCQVCQKMLEKGRYCMACKFAVYCSEECQKADWTSHKQCCYKVEYAPKFVKDDIEIKEASNNVALRFLDDYSADLYKYM